MNRCTYKVSWPNGSCRYFKNAADARRAYAHDSDPLTGMEKQGSSLTKVRLADDAFERAANGDGGYELDESTMASRTTTK